MGYASHNNPNSKDFRGDKVEDTKNRIVVPSDGFMLPLNISPANVRYGGSIESFTVWQRFLRWLGGNVAN